MLNRLCEKNHKLLALRLFQGLFLVFMSYEFNLKGRYRLSLMDSVSQIFIIWLKEISFKDKF